MILLIPVCVFTVRKAVIGMMAMHRLQDHHSPTSAGANSSSQQSQSQSNPEKEKMQSDLDEYKKQAEEVSGSCLERPA